MKTFNVLLCLILFSISNCQGQPKKHLIGTKKVEDLSKYPVYKWIAEEKEGEMTLKEKYKYVDSIDVYGMAYSSDGLKVRGFISRPRKPGKYPCIIYNRGGNSEFGALKIFHAVMQMGELASKGYIVIASNYRGNGGSEGQEEFGGADINDVTILIEVLKEIEGADTTKIGMYGGSRGGMMTYIALTKTDQIKAAAVVGAVSDCYAGLTRKDGDFEKAVYEKLIPNYRANKEQELDKRSAIKWADKFPKDVPILMMHGTSDWRVTPDQSLRLAMEFEKFKVPYRLIIFEGGDHGISEHREEVNEQVVSWFDRFLKQNEVLPNMEDHGR